MSKSDENINPALLEIAKSNGYEKVEYGYRKITEDNTHWITFFGMNSLQMYAYFSEDSEFDDIYNTQVLKEISEEELKTLINVLVNNHS